MSGPANDLNPPRHSGGASWRTTLVVIAVAALVAILAFALYELRDTGSDTRTGLLERGMSPGHRMLNQEAGRTLPSNSPRIQRADALITRVSSRFRLSKDKVADLALATRGKIAVHQSEDIFDVLDAALFATDGIPPGDIPSLPALLAAYSRVRIDGGSVLDARNGARVFAHVAAKDANALPRR